MFYHDICYCMSAENKTTAVSCTGRRYNGSSVIIYGTGMIGSYHCLCRYTRTEQEPHQASHGICIEAIVQKNGTLSDCHGLPYHGLTMDEIPEGDLDLTKVQFYVNGSSVSLWKVTSLELNTRVYWTGAVQRDTFQWDGRQVPTTKYEISCVALYARILVSIGDKERIIRRVFPVKSLCNYLYHAICIQEDEEKKTTSKTVYDSVTGMPSGSSTLAGLDVMDDHAPTTSRLDPTFSSEMTSPTQDRTMGSHSTSRTTNICPSRPTTSSVNTDSETTIQTFLPTDGNGNVSNSSSSQVVNVTLGYDSETVYTTSSTVKNISYEATPSGGDDRTTEPVCGTATGSRNSSLIASVVGGTMSFIVICCVILAFYIKIKRKTVKDSDTQRSHSVTVQNSEYEHVYENEVATPKFTTDGTYESVDSHSKYINVQEQSTDAKPRIEISDSSELYESYKQ